MGYKVTDYAARYMRGESSIPMRHHRVLKVDFIAPNFYCEQHPDSPFNKDEMFALKTAEGRVTLDGHIYKEFKHGDIFVKELSDEEMPQAYARFGLKK